MLEPDLASTELPEKPALTTPENESIEPANSPSENSLFKKIRENSEKVFDKFALPFKRGRGRPKNCSECGKPETKCKCPQPPPPDARKIEVEFDSVARPAVVPNHSALLAGRLHHRGAVFLASLKTSPEKKPGKPGLIKNFTEAALKECEVEPEVMADFNESLAIVLEKYRVNTEYAPEMALGIAAARMASPYIMLFKTFDDEIKRKRAQEKSGGGK